VAGLRIAQKLENRSDMKNNRIILIDENDYHQYLHRIHEVCNHHYEENEIIVPFSRILRGTRIKFVKAKVKSIDVEEKIVETTNGQQRYDILAITLGSHPTYFGIQGLEENSYTLGSFKQAKEIRAKIQELFNEASEKGEPPKILIGGSGFTGVELAGEIADWYPILCDENGFGTPSKVLTLVEAMPSILPGWDAKLIERGQKILRSLGIELLLNDPIIKVDNIHVTLKSGTVLKPDLFVWAGGVMSDPICATKFKHKNRRVVTDEYNRLPSFDDIYIAGDCACAIDESKQPQPPTAHIAMVQGDVVVHNIHATLTGGSLKKYKFNRAGEIITLGKTNAIGVLFDIKFTGALAKFMKKVVHLWYLHSIGGFNLLLSKYK
jgi:NADH dehydrogenase